MVRVVKTEQHIHVDPVTEGVSLVLGGPEGPQGPQGEVSKATLESAVAGLTTEIGKKVDKSKLDSRESIMWIHHGTGTPTLAGFPGARVGDVIRRMSDGQEWRVDA